MKRKKIKATYRNGVIEPLDRIDLPEGQELEVEFSILQKTPREFTPEEATQTYTALIRQSEGWWIGWILVHTKQRRGCSSSPWWIYSSRRELYGVNHGRC